MPFSNINITLTAAQVTAIQAAINALKAPANMPVQFNLTKGERKSVPNISDERYPYAKRSVQIHAPNNPILVSGLAGTTVEATNDFNFYDQMEGFIQQLTQVVEIYQDTQQVAGSECYKWMRELYRSAQSGAENNLPGADTVADDLAQLFEGQGPQNQSPQPTVFSIAAGGSITVDRIAAGTLFNNTGGTDLSFSKAGDPGLQALVTAGTSLAVGANFTPTIIVHNESATAAGSFSIVQQ